MTKSKKELINNIIPKLWNIEWIKKIKLEIHLKDWSIVNVENAVRLNKKYSTKKEIIERLCRSKLFNRHSIDEPIPDNLSLSNIDHIILKKLS